MNQTELDVTAGPPGETPDAGAPGIVFRPDPEAAALRTVLWMAFAFAGPATLALVAVWLDWAIAQAAVPASLGVLAAAAAALLAMPRPADSDALVLDRDGLTLTQAGRRERWTWSELGDFAIETRSGLAGRLIGERVVIRKGPQRRRLIGSCLASPEEIAEQLAAYRDRAMGRDAVNPSEAPISSTRFNLADQFSRREKTMNAATAALVGVAIVWGVSAGVAGLTRGWDAFVSYWIDPMSQRVPLTLLIGFAAYDLWIWLRRLPIAANQMIFEASGLVIASEGQRRRWRWELVSEPEIQDLPESDDGKDRRIVFFARHDGISRDGTLPAGLRDGAVRIVIDDLYDASLETIVARFNAFRAGARIGVSADAGQQAPSPLPN